MLTYEEIIKNFDQCQTIFKTNIDELSQLLASQFPKYECYRSYRGNQGRVYETIQISRENMRVLSKVHMSGLIEVEFQKKNKDTHDFETQSNKEFEFKGGESGVTTFKDFLEAIGTHLVS